jgi:uncharacterized membrane protein
MSADKETTADQPRETDQLREALLAEYKELLKIVSDFDGRLLTIKSWAVTVSLVSIGLGFQQGHYALFAAASLGAFCFWLVEAVTKRHQMRYYPRMRDIEVTLGELLSWRSPRGPVSAPQVDWSWEHGLSGRLSLPEPYTAGKYAEKLRKAPFLSHVMIPSLAIAVVGGALFLAGVTTTWLGPLKP